MKQVSGLQYTHYVITRAKPLIKINAARLLTDKIYVDIVRITELQGCKNQIPVLRYNACRILWLPAIEKTINPILFLVIS